MDKPWRESLEKVVGPCRKDRLDDKEKINEKAQSIAFRIPPNPYMLEKLIEDISLAISC